MAWHIDPVQEPNTQTVLKELLPMVNPAGDDRTLQVKKWAEPGFCVEANRQRIEIRYHDLRDLGRGLLEAATCPADDCAKQGRCVFADFGVMVDISRNAVLRPQAIRKLIRLSALMGYSFVGLYMEDTICLPGEPYFGYQRGAMAAEELKELDRYAAGLGLELRPYLQTLAHLNQIMRYQRYDEIRDTEDILLAGEERTYQLLDKLLGTVAECFTTRKVNIGMDEAALVGAGKYLEKNGYEPRIQVLQKHLQKILAICDTYHLQPQMWSDMFFNLAYGSYDQAAAGAQAKCKPEIPPQVELGFWDYYHLGKERYQSMLQKHKQMTDKVVFAGGAWKWSGFTPCNAFSIATGRDALEACIEEKIRSVVITAWGDNGAEASAFSVLPVLYADAALAWGKQKETHGFRILTGIAFDDFLELDRPSRFSDDPAVHGNASKFLLYNDPLLGTFDSLVPEGVGAFYTQAAERLEQVEETAGEYGILFRTQRELCRVLEQKADLGKRIKEAYDRKDRNALRTLAKKTIPQTLERLTTFHHALQEQWMQENKAFGWEVQDLRLGGLESRLAYTQACILHYLDGTREVIEELEGERLPFAYFDNSEIAGLNYNLWAFNATPAVL